MVCGKMVRLSLVIPAYNQEKHLPQLLQSVEEARSRYRAGADQIEVIVADNASTDATAAIAGSRGCRVVEVEKRSIACTRNAGAGVACGEILAFVDADSPIDPETFNEIDKTLSDKVVIGATGVRMSRSSPGIAITMLVAQLILRIAGADTGVIFCRRADWKAVGGYNEDRTYAEDVEFLFAMKRLGRTRRQRFARASGVPTITSARKFDQFGDWHLFSNLGRAFFWLLFDRDALKRFTEEYWYRRR